MENDEEIQKSLDRLDELSKFKKNWNGYGADPFSKELIDKCKNIVMNLPHQLEIYPTAGNSIQFEWEFSDGSYLEFDVEEDETSYYFSPADECEEFEEEAMLRGDEELNMMIFEIDKLLDMFE